MKHLEDTSYTPYRSKRSTETAVTIFIDEIRTNVDKGNLVGTVFLDLSKALDTISHAKVLDKLPHYGISRLE